MNAVCTSPTIVDGKLVRVGRVLPVQADQEPDLSQLKLAELRMFAQEHGIDVSKAKSKAETLALIEAEMALRVSHDEASASP